MSTPASAMARTARGLSPWVSIPAECASMRSPFRRRAQPSAIWLRQEFPVQRKRTFSLPSLVAKTRLLALPSTSPPSPEEQALPLHVLRQHPLQTAEEPVQAPADEVVVDGRAFLPVSDEPRSLQHRQVPGDRRLVRAGERRQLVHAHLPVLQQVQDEHARGVAHGLRDLGSGAVVIPALALRVLQVHAAIHWYMAI